MTRADDLLGEMAAAGGGLRPKTGRRLAVLVDTPPAEPAAVEPDEPPAAGPAAIPPDPPAAVQADELPGRLAATRPLSHAVPLDVAVAVERLKFDARRQMGRKVTNDDVVDAAMRLLPDSTGRAVKELARLGPVGEGQVTRKLTANHACDDWFLRLHRLQVEALEHGHDVPQRLFFLLAVRLLLEAGVDAVA